MLFRFKEKLGKQILSRVNEISSKPPPGFKPYGLYFTLGQYDAVWHVEVQDQNQALDVSGKLSDIAHIESLVAIPKADVEKII